jgi:hypothetical protein
MRVNLTEFTYEIELQPGEKLSLPQALVDSVGPGRWLITISPVQRTSTKEPIRSHSAFLNSYAPEDEGLYDDYPAR